MLNPISLHFLLLLHKQTGNILGIIAATFLTSKTKTGFHEQKKDILVNVYLWSISLYQQTVQHDMWNEGFKWWVSWPTNLPTIKVKKSHVHIDSNKIPHQMQILILFDRSSYQVLQKYLYLSINSCYTDVTIHKGWHKRNQVWKITWPYITVATMLGRP